MIRRLYSNLKIQTKFTLAILAAVLIPFAILGLIFSNELYNMIIADTIKDAQDATSEISPKVSQVISDITAVNSDITSDIYYERIFYTSTGRSLDEIPFTDEADHFKKMIKNYAKEGINIRIYVGVPEGCTFLTAKSSQGVFFPISKAKGTYWYGIFQGTKGSKLFCPGAYLSSFEREHLGDNAYITYMTAYMDGNIYPCYMAIYYSSDTYKDILLDNMSFDNGVSYIINDREEIIATTNEALSATYRLDYDSIKESLMASNSFISRQVLDEKVYVAFYYIPETKWFIVSVMPEGPLLDTGRLLMVRYVFIVLACVTLAIFVAMLQSHSITSRISKIIHQMSAVKNGPPRPMDEPVSNDEVGELISTYNYMAVEMQNLIKQEQKTAENLRIAEFNALQAQINPHFLYNTMDMINWMAKDGRTEEISDVVQRLSRFYKLTLSRKNTINSIADELEHVQIYIELMNMRHGNCIDFVIDMPDELTNFSIPKLTLQPIVENAILHGILEKPDKSGTIIITGWEEGDDIILIVADDGVGIPSDRLKDVLSPFPISPTKGSNVAISNIHHRLQLLWGDGYGLTYSSTEGKGTEVTIKIPQLIG